MFGLDTRPGADIEKPYLGWPTQGTHPTFDPNVRARALRRSRSPLPLPEFWIKKGYSAYRASVRSWDVIHRGPSCPASDLNVPWREPEQLGVGVAFDLAAIDVITRLCGFCFTETEIETMSTLSYFETPARSHAERVEHAREIEYSRALSRGQGIVLLDVAEMLSVAPGVAVAEVWFNEDGVPQLSADLATGLVRRSGHTLRLSDGKNDQGLLYAKCEIIRDDDPEFTYTVVWTEDDAVAQGLGGDEIYQANKRATLKRRVSLEAIRDACAEVLMGIDAIPAAVSAAA